MQFRLDGVQEALANLKSIGEAVSDRNLQEDGLIAVEPIAEDARSLAPVDKGDLRDSIQATIFEDGTVGVISASTVSNACSKSRLISVRAFCARK